MKLLVRLVCLPLAALILISCASTAPSADAGPRRSSDVITREEIEATGRGNAYEIIEELRPRWLRPRTTRSLNMSTSVLVYVDSYRLGGIESLRGVTARSIASIRFLDAAQATAQLPGIGSQHVAGAIVITARTGTD